MNRNRIKQLAFSLACTAVLAGCSSTPEPRTRPTVMLTPEEMDARLKTDLEGLQGHVNAYWQRYGELPARLPDLRETPDGEALLELIPRDPWNVPYLLRRLGDDVVIYSTGPDLIVGSQDDVRLRMSFEGVASPSKTTPES